MGKPKSPLKYFARLIDFDGLNKRRAAIYDECVGRAMGQGALLTDDETVVYEDYELGLRSKFPQHYMEWGVIGQERPSRARPPMHLFKPAHPATRDLKEEICSEVQQQTSKSKTKLYEQLNAGTQAQQEQVYKQALRDLDRWSGVIANDSLFSKYPCVADALRGIKAYLESYNPLPKEEVATDAPTPKMEPVVGFLYQHLEVGATPDRIKRTTQRHLDKLYGTLKDDLKFIAPETTLENFCKLFSGQIISVPVRWLGTNGQLRYLIKCIESKLTMGPKKWEIAAACFIKSTGEVFTSRQIESTGTGARGVPMAAEIEVAAKKLK